MRAYGPHTQNPPKPPHPSQREVFPRLPARSNPPKAGSLGGLEPKNRPHHARSSCDMLPPHSSHGIVSLMSSHHTTLDFVRFTPRRRSSPARRFSVTASPPVNRCHSLKASS